jgi:hypothetical protein
VSSPVETTVETAASHPVARPAAEHPKAEPATPEPSHAASGKTEKKVEERTKVADDNESRAAAEEAAQEVAATEEEKSDELAAEPAAAMAPVVVTPHRKLWLGVIDLERKKRIAKSTTRPFEIAPEGRFLVLTGHGRFEITDGLGNRFAYDDLKRHYLLVEDGLVRPIDAATFKRLNGGRLW